MANAHSISKWMYINICASVCMYIYLQTNLCVIHKGGVKFWASAPSRMSADIVDKAQSMFQDFSNCHELYFKMQIDTRMSFLFLVEYVTYQNCCWGSGIMIPEGWGEKGNEEMQNCYQWLTENAPESPGVWCPRTTSCMATALSLQSLKATSGFLWSITIWRHFKKRKSIFSQLHYYFY
jgi:uncharacterized protein YbdZ (MbtH family)